MWYQSPICDMTHWYVTQLIHVWHDSFICDTTHPYVTSLIHLWYDWFMYNMTHSYVTWLIHMWHHPFICDITHSYGIHAWQCYIWMSHDSFICNTMNTCDVTHDSFICNSVTYEWDMTHSYVTRWIHVTRLIHIWRDSFICVTWLIHIWHDSFICVTWLIHMCDTTYSYLWHASWIDGNKLHLTSALPGSDEVLRPHTYIHITYVYWCIWEYYVRIRVFEYMWTRMCICVAWQGFAPPHLHIYYMRVFECMWTRYVHIGSVTKLCASHLYAYHMYSNTRIRTYMYSNTLIRCIHITCVFLSICAHVTCIYAVRRYVHRYVYLHISLALS